MKQKMVSHSSKELKSLRKAGKSRTDWARVSAMKDADIDFSDSPELTPELFARVVARDGLPSGPRKAQLTLRLDTDVVEWFKAQGRGYQTRINTLLRAYRDAYLKQR